MTADVSSKGAPIANVVAPARSPGTGLKKGALLNWASLGVSIVTAFLVTPLIIHRLGNSGFGTWALIQSFSGYYGLVNIGLGSALLRTIAHDIAADRMRSLQTTVSTATAFFAVSGGLIVVVVAAMALPAARFFHQSPSEAPWFALTIFVAAVAVVLDFFGAVTSSFLSACERFDWLNTLGIGRQLTQAAGTVTVLWLQPTILGIALVILGSSMIFLLISARLASRLVPEVRLLCPGFSATRLKELLGYGGSTVLLTVSNLVRLRLGNLIIARFSGVGAVAGYSIAVSLVTNFSQVLSSSMSVLNPRFTRLDAQARQAELFRLYRTALFVSSTIAFGLGTMLLLFGERFIVFWLGKNPPEAVPVLKVLVMAYAIALAQSPAWNLMFAVSKHHFMARISLIEAGVNIAIGLWLTSLYGAIGFAWATAGAMLISKIFIQPPYSAKIGGLKLNEYLAPMTIPFITAVAIGGFAVWGQLQTLLAARGILFFFGAATVFSVAYFAVVGLFCHRKDYMPAFVGGFMKRWRLKGVSQGV